MSAFSSEGKGAMAAEMGKINIQQHYFGAVVLLRTLLASLLVAQTSGAVCEEYYLGQGEINAGEKLSYANDYQPGIYTTTGEYDDESSEWIITDESSVPYSPTVEPTLMDRSRLNIKRNHAFPMSTQCGIQGFFAQVDYFYWHEADSTERIEESGPLVTLGYQARKPDKRYRLAIFFGDVNTEGDFPPDDSLELFTSDSDYLGAILEYDFRWRFSKRPSDAIFAGIGMRYWSRSVNMTLDTPYPEYSGLPAHMKQNWWTVYPRVGIDINRYLRNGWHFYMSSCIGLTAYTSEDCASDVYLDEKIELYDVTVHPKCGLYSQIELSLRKNRMFFSLMLEQMGWNQSDAEEDEGLYQSDAYMLSAGILAGFTY